eukprot:SAG22_NODE_13393_length_408_cov_0.957929_1_plen_22_part_10
MLVLSLLLFVLAPPATVQRHAL